MPLLVVHPGGSHVDERKFERSPYVVVETDAPSAESIPPSLLAAANLAEPKNIEAWAAGKPPAGADGVITWLAGEQLLCGSPASIRHALRFPGRRSFVPVHFPCLEEMPLVALQPRWLCSGPRQDYWDFSIRIAGSAPASPQVVAALRQSGQSWAKLSLALLADWETPQRGIELLGALWEDRGELPTMLAALALRNLIALLLRYDQCARAEQLLDFGTQLFPGYSELSLLAAWNHIRQNRAGRAVPFLDRARSGDRGFLGCGGESSYRPDWLLGLVALRVGNERMAFDHFRSGLLARPIFPPAVEQLLHLRLPPKLVAAHETELQQAAFQNPALLGKIFDFLLIHRAFEAAGQLIETPYLPEASRDHLRDALRAAHAPYRSSQALAVGTSPGVIFSGPFFEHTSLGRINREIAASAVSYPSLKVCIEPSIAATAFPRLFPKGELLAPTILRHLDQLNLTVRHQWPPDFRRPPKGKLAVILPWEYGSVPRVWVRDIERNVDEVWVPSTFVRDVLRNSGVTNTPVEVIPNGFDPSFFKPDGPISRPLGCRKFSFLFVGGAIRRKGIDLLLDAYRMAFDPGEDVTLVAYVSGLAGSYRHNSLLQRLQEMAADPSAPHLQILNESLEDATLAGLYRGCNAFVLPYRGEGFGMPLVEAMACGKPVITTNAGPSLDFCSDKTSFLISAREEIVLDDPPPLGEFAGPFTWFEPDLGELPRLLRHVYENPRDVANRGHAAAAAVRNKFTWERIARLYRSRIGDLAGSKGVSCGDGVEVSSA